MSNIIKNFENKRYLDFDVIDLEILRNLMVNGDLTVTGSSNIGVDETITGQLLLDDGTATNPALTFASDADTGFYKIGDGTIGITSGGSNRFRLSYDGFYSPGRAFMSSTGVTNTTPAFSFDDDKDTGIGHNTADELSLIAGGIEGLRINANESEVQPKMTLAVSSTEFEEDSGAVTAMNMPVTSDSSDGDEMSMSFSIDSSPVLKVKGSADGTGGADNFQILISKGSASLPGFSFINDPHTGFYNNGSGSVQFRSNSSSGPIFSTGILFGNADKPYFLNASSSDTVPVLLPAQGDINTGIGHAAADQLSLIAGGVEATRLTTTATETKTGRIRNTTIVNSATYDLLATDDILLVTYTSTGAVTSLTLPTAQTVNGRVIVIKDAGGNATTNNITIDTEGSEMIDGSATAVIDGDYESVTLVSDGSNWFLIKGL